MFENNVLILIIFLGIIGVSVIYNNYVRPKMLHWGATKIEVMSKMAGDDLIDEPAFTTTRAIEINAGPENVWPWLAQMGQGRGGFYSYTWLENLAGLDIHNIDKIDSELQDIKVGDTIPFWKGNGVEILELEPFKLLLLAGTLYNRTKEEVAEEQPGGTWVFQIEDKGSEKTRLVIRSRVAKFKPKWLSAIIYRVMLEPMHYIMERGMMYGIRKRSEIL